MNDNTEAKEILSKLYTDINNNKEIDTDDYAKDLVLRSYNLLDKNYSLNYLFGRLKDDEKVVAAVKAVDGEDEYEEKINYLAKGNNFTVN
ncbi:hypothetical protein ACFQ5I_07400 [Companilactobacillus mishanensis]|nr:hypothetical protein [Companilactobacillus mishanensis]